MATTTKYHEKIRARFALRAAKGWIDHGVTAADIADAIADYDDDNIPALLVPNKAYLYYMKLEQAEAEGFGERSNASNETLIFCEGLTMAMVFVAL